MAFKLLLAAKLLLVPDERWRRVHAPRLVTLVKPGVGFSDAEAEMLQPEPAPADLFTHTAAVFAASDVSIHKI